MLTGIQLQLVNKMTCLPLNWGECICLQQWHITREVRSFARYYILFSPWKMKTASLDSGLRTHPIASLGDEKQKFKDGDWLCSTYNDIRRIRPECHFHVPRKKLSDASSLLISFSLSGNVFVHIAWVIYCMLHRRNSVSSRSHTELV